MIFLYLIGCNLIEPENQCVQIDVVPAAEKNFVNAAMDFEIAACSCGSTTTYCQDEDLISLGGIPIELSVSTYDNANIQGDIGSDSDDFYDYSGSSESSDSGYSPILSTNTVYASNGKSNVQLYSNGFSGWATLNATLGNYRGAGSVEFTNRIELETFTLSVDQTEVTAGLVPARFTTEVYPAFDGMEIAIETYPELGYDGSLGEVRPSVIEVYQNQAQFSFQPSENLSEDTTIEFVAKFNNMQQSNIVSLNVKRDIDFDIQPKNVTLPINEVLTFRLLGEVEDPFWTVQNGVEVLCDGGSLESCRGKTEVQIQVVDAPCIMWDYGEEFELEPMIEEYCNVVLWATDDATGSQTNATIHLH